MHRINLKGVTLGRAFHPARLLGLTTLLTLSFTGADKAWAQNVITVLPTDPFTNPNPGTPSVFTTTNNEALQFAPATQITNQATANATEIIGTLNGGSPLYDQSFNALFNTPTVQNGVAAARAVITSSGGPGVIISTPTLTSTAISSSSNASSIYTLDSSTPVSNTLGPNTTFVTTSSFGPDVIFATVQITYNGTAYNGNPNNPNAGVYSSCNIATLPSSTKPTCASINGGQFDLLNGQAETNVAKTTTYLIDTTTTTTVTTTTTQIYTLNGTTEQSISVQPIGGIHSAVPEAGFDQVMNFDRRLLDAGLGSDSENIGPAFVTYADSALSDADHIPSPKASLWHLWGETYGYVANTASTSNALGNNRSTVGFHGGLGYDVTPSLRLGVAFDYGGTNISQTSANEVGSTNLTEIGLYAAWHQGALFANITGTDSWGDAKTSITPPAGTLVDTANYRLSVQSVAGESGIHLPYQIFVFTPSIGGSYIDVNAGSFTETGSALALQGAATNYHRFEGWLGLKAEAKYTIGHSLLAVEAYGRALALGGDQRINVPVNFVGNTTQLSISGAQTGTFGGDVGAAAAYIIAPNAKLYLAYDAGLRSSYTSQAGSGGVAIAF